MAHHILKILSNIEAELESLKPRSTKGGFSLPSTCQDCLQYNIRKMYHVSWQYAWKRLLNIKGGSVCPVYISPDLHSSPLINGHWFLSLLSQRLESQKFNVELIQRSKIYNCLTIKIKQLNQENQEIFDLVCLQKNEQLNDIYNSLHTNCKYCTFSYCLAHDQIVDSNGSKVLKNSKEWKVGATLRIETSVLKQSIRSLDLPSILQIVEFAALTNCSISPLVRKFIQEYKDESIYRADSDDLLGYSREWFANMSNDLEILNRVYKHVIKLGLGYKPPSTTEIDFMALANIITKHSTFCQKNQMNYLMIIFFYSLVGTVAPQAYTHQDTYEGVQYLNFKFLIEPNQYDHIDDDEDCVLAFIKREVSAIEQHNQKNAHDLSFGFIETSMGAME